MNHEEIQELQQLRLELSALQAGVQQLQGRLRALELSAATAHQVTPPPLPSQPALAPADRIDPREPAAPPALPLTSPARPVGPGRPLPSEVPSGVASTPSSYTPPPLPAKPRESFELQLGAVWLARIGIVMLLTGLVFLGNYAWQTFGSHLGAGGKLSLLYLASAALAGVGAWMHRRQPALRLYSQVLMGGGAALAYYSTYAAHYVARLRVIESPLLGGALLLACGAGLLTVAERRRWQLAALLTILLSYYTAGINPIGEFTLYSNGLLTLAGIVLLVRQRWTSVTWATLAGTYGSYAFWHLYRHAAGTGLRAEEPWLTGLTFLCCYWSFFTAAVFLARAESFPARPRVTFLTLNNAAFLAFALDHLHTARPSALWEFCLLAGGAFLALAAAAWKWRREEPALDGAYLLQGVALVTAGLAQKLAGPQLGVTLAVESLILLTGVARRHGWIYFSMAAVLAGWAFGLGLYECERSTSVILPLGSSLALLFIANAWWLKQRSGELAVLRWSWRAAWFAGLGLLMLALVLEQQSASAAWKPILFAVAAVVCTASVYALRLKEVVLGGQLFLFWAINFCLIDHAAREPWWFIWPVAACALTLAHWWQRQRILPLDRAQSLLLQVLSAAALVVFGFGWLQQHLGGDLWLAALSAAALGTLLYGRLTRSWSIAACGQLFALGSVLVFAQSLPAEAVRWPAGLTPALMALLTWFLLPASVGRSRESLPLVAGYWWGGLVLVAVWAFRYLPEGWLALFFAGVFLVLLGAAAWRKHPLSAFGSAAFALLTFVGIWMEQAQAPGLRSLAALLIVPAAARLALRHTGENAPEARRAVSVISGLAAGSLWLWVTRWCQWHGYARSLTVAWSGVALLVLGAGLAVRERVYRVGGFLILALAVARIFSVDVWQLETIYRILSFLSLGGVLLLLGFLYSRYSEQIRRWL